MSVKKNQAIYTRGPIGRTMMKTAFAMVAGTLAMSGYNIADTFFVGQLHSEIPLAAMGFTFPVIMLIGCVFRGLGVGVMTTTAQALGGGRHGRAARLATSGLVLVFLFSVVLAVLGMVTINGTFECFGAQGEALAAGDSRVASGMMMAGMIINVILDPLFIFGVGPFPAMGISGAALATIFSQLLATVTLLWLLYRRHGLIVPEVMPWRQLRSAWMLMIRFAIPAALGMLLMPIGSAVITRITAEFGNTAVAATAAAGRLEMVAFIFPMALGISLLPMIGQNYGARLYSRINQCRRFAMRFAFWFLLVMAGIYFVFAPQLVRFFSADPGVQEIMIVYMRIIPFGFGMIEIHRYSGFFFTGCGLPSIAAWLNALRIVGLMIPLSLLALWFGSLAGLFWARLAADLLAGGIGWFLASKMTRRLPGDGEPPPVRSAGLGWRRMLPRRLLAIAEAKSNLG